MTKMNEQMYRSVKVYGERLTAIDGAEMKNAADELRSIVRTIRQAIGEEPKGATLAVQGRFVSGSLVWSIVYRYIDNNPLHIEYHRLIRNGLPMPYDIKSAA